MGNGNYFHFLGTLSGFPAFRLVPMRFITPIKAPSPVLPLACFGTVLEESEGKWEG